MNSLELILDFAEEVLIPIGICVVLPIIIVWLNMRRKTNETNRRTEVLLAAIEKNPDLDMVTTQDRFSVLFCFLGLIPFCTTVCSCAPFHSCREPLRGFAQKHQTPAWG